MSIQVGKNKVLKAAPTMATNDIADLYQAAHLMVATVRVLTHQRRIPPSLSAVCQALCFSEEHGLLVCRRLIDLGVLEMTTAAHDNKLFIKDHLAIEAIPRGNADSRLDEELRRFQAGRSQINQKVESIQAQAEEKKRKLFAQLEEQLKKPAR